MANGVAIMPPARRAEPEALSFALSRLATPIGVALVATDDQGRLRVFEWEDHAARMQGLLDRFYGAGRARLVEGVGGGTARPVLGRLKAYFAGDLAAIDDIAAESAGTEFQRKVWKMLRRIPAGETWSYNRLAKRVGRPDAVRAVGAANGANPISVVVPCHRVIGANGSLTGYGGGLERKAWLLRHEGARVDAAA
ncbi:MAG TPA: methylated-DNA--[protein]-cysteine S-methyltransferase [Dongiaceae bacterium]|jgi:methylated-DNA-[protein]-cysteine S-methyltransferase|nr:methylated-DNA--[protein]-cysteine S-methyltransferase [Dongiaceae bacterium]